LIRRTLDFASPGENDLQTTAYATNPGVKLLMMAKTDIVG